MRAHRVVFAVGVLLVVSALIPPLHDLAFESLTMHLLQNVMLAEWAPALLVFGLAPEAGRRLAELMPFWFGLPVWLLTYYVWHAPPLYDAALENPTPLLHLEHASYLAAGIALWLPVVHGPLDDGPKAAYIFAAFVLAAPLGLLLALLPSPAYDFYDGHWGLTALADQQIAGVTMASEEAVVFFAAFAFYLRRFMREAA